MTPDTVEKWDRRYTELAQWIAGWSKDPKAQVGAVLLDRRDWPIALGYNGFPAGVEDDVERLQDNVLKNEMVVHAEQNALLCAGSQARGGTLYVYGKPVCPRCAVLIIQAGIKKVVGVQPDPHNNPESDTHRTGKISLNMFREAKVNFSPSVQDREPKTARDIISDVLRRVEVSDFNDVALDLRRALTQMHDDRTPKRRFGRIPIMQTLGRFLRVDGHT